MSERTREIRDRIAQNDVTVMRSYLEVDVANWFSENEIPYGYEAFTIPSVVGPNQDNWSSMIDGVRAIGRGDEEQFEGFKMGTPFESMSAFEVLDLWNRVYDKHRLQEEDITIPVREALQGFDKQLVLPDFALYPDADVRVAGEDFDWSNWSSIVEVSGLWGVGLPGEAEEEDWWTWYRVSAVAFKELAYRLLGIWENVYWVVPFQPHIPGVSQGIPRALRDDDHYVIANITRSDLGMDELADRIGVTADIIDAGLSPPIEPVQYRRPVDGLPSSIVPVEYSFDGINFGNTDNNERAVVVGGGNDEAVVVFHGEMGEVYLRGEGDGASVHVRESQWRNQNMILLREYVLESLRELADDGIVEGLSELE